MTQTFTLANLTDITGGSGTVTQVNTGTGLTGGPITTSGTISLTTPVPVADGGTGVTSYTDGQLLIGDSSTGGLDVATLSAGANINITNGHGSISVAAVPSLPMTTQNVSANTTLTQPVVCLYDPTGGNITITLPTNAQMTGKCPRLTFKNKTNNATNSITLTPQSGTIEGGSTYVLAPAGYAIVWIFWDGTNWWTWA